MILSFRALVRSGVATALVASQLTNSACAEEPSSNPFEDIPAAKEAAKTPTDDALKSTLDPHQLSKYLAGGANYKVRYLMEVEQLEALIRQRLETQKFISDLTLRIELAKLLAANAKKNMVPEEDIEAAISKDARIQEAMRDLTALMHKQRQLELDPKDQANDTALARNKNEIQMVRENLEEIKSEDRQSVINQLMRQGEADGSKLQVLELEQQLLIASLGQTMKNIEAQAEAVERLARFEGDADQLREELAERKSLIREMATTLTKRRIDLDAPPRVNIYQSAVVPYVIRPAQQGIVTVISAFVGFSLMFAMVVIARFAWRRIRRRPKTQTSIESTGVPPPSRRFAWALTLLLATLAGAGCGALAWFLLPTQYETMALLQIQTVAPSILEEGDGKDFARYCRAVAAILKSPLVLNKALDHTSVQSLPIVRTHASTLTNWLHDELVVESSGDSELMTVSMRNEDPNGLKEIVDAVLGAYKDEVIDKERSDRLARVLTLEKKLREFKEALLDKQRQLFDLSKSL